MNKWLTTKKEQLVRILQDLKKTDDILGSSVISRDGLLIANDLSEKIDIKTFAAMNATVTGTAETAVSELKQGNLKQIIIDAEKSKIISTSAGNLAILVVLAKPKINIGLILLEMKRVANKILNVLGRS